jgi:hypothetical protein
MATGVAEIQRSATGLAAAVTNRHDPRSRKPSSQRTGSDRSAGQSADSRSERVEFTAASSPRQPRFDRGLAVLLLLRGVQENMDRCRLKYGRFASGYPTRSPCSNALAESVVAARRRPSMLRDKDRNVLRRTTVGEVSGCGLLPAAVCAGGSSLACPGTSVQGGHEKIRMR